MAKNIKTFIFLLLYSTFIFLILDYSFSYKYFPYIDGKMHNDFDPYILKDDGWYELKKDFSGAGQWGGSAYTVNTDLLGFRSKELQKNTTRSNYIFLGDSFTFGVNGDWNETFVGMYENKIKQKVINAGVPSYSPTAYLHQYIKAINANALNDKHTIVIGLDISDVQDESTCWKSGADNPIKMNGPCKHLFSNGKEMSFIEKIYDRLRFSRNIYIYIDRRINPTKYGISIHNEVFTRARSAITWDSWSNLNIKGYPDGYAPNGIQYGLDKIKKTVNKISELAKESDSRLYLLIYPWPAQIKFDDRFTFGDWVGKLCLDSGCDGVINTMPIFRSESGKDWYKEYYMQGDIHFNQKGNKLIFKELLKVIK